MDYSSNILSIKIVYILINSLNILVMWKVGGRLKYCRTNEEYWKLSLGIILSYSIMMGLRFGRMIDYNLYYDRYVEAGSNFSSSGYEYFFKSICWVIYNVGLPYQFFIWFCSVILICSVIYLAKDYKQYAPYMFLLFLWEAHNAELLIRWYLAFAFFVFAFARMKNKYYISAVVLAVLSMEVHVGMLVLVVICAFLYVIKKQILPSWAVATLFVINLLIGSVGILDFISPYVSLLGVDKLSSSYVNQFDDIIHGEFGKIGFMDERSYINIIRRILAYLFPIFYMSILLKKRILSSVEVNLFSLGVILSPLLFQVEILNRYGEGLMFFSIIVSAVSCSYVLKYRPNNNSWLYYTAAISFFCNVWPVFSAVFGRDKWWQMLFVWDAEGRGTLPLSLFLN